MKGEKFLRVLVILLCCVVASYVLFSVLRTPESGFTTYKAVRYEVGDGITTSGFVVRSEVPVTGGEDPIVVFTRAEGERVGKGQSLASTFRNAEARDRQDRIDALEQELAQLEYAYSFSSSDVESATLDSDITRLMNQVSVFSSRRDFSQARTAAEDLKVHVLRRYITATDNEALRSRITAAQERLNELCAQADAESGSITAEVSGYFSSTVDGYETELTPELLELIDVAQIRSHLGIGKKQTDAIAKLVTSPKWYYVTLADTESVRTMEAGDRIDVQFAYDLHQTVRMKVERITPSLNGQSGLILSSERSIQYAVTSRSQTADLIFSNRVGLRVPETAVYVNEKGESGVYVLEGAEARWKTVNILYEDGESFLVELDKSSTRNLWPEDEIILTTDTIFEGKVMIK